MKEIKLETAIRVYTKEELTQQQVELMNEAISAAKDAYAPYSKFYVGAAVRLENGVVVKGSNQENAAYPSGLCAERVALFYAGAIYPDVPVKAIAVTALVGGKQVGLAAPCGGCRQVLLESEMRAGANLEILLCGAEEIYVMDGASSLLPISFDASVLPD
ncbi:MAG: cytidine deaminase [Tannerellaceae bacterium]|nr:cytidine deaminase [Tannerellaceae bacterium]